MLLPTSILFVSFRFSKTSLPDLSRHQDQTYYGHRKGDKKDEEEAGAILTHIVGLERSFIMTVSNVCNYVTFIFSTDFIL